MWRGLIKAHTVMFVCHILGTLLYLIFFIASAVMSISCFRAGSADFLAFVYVIAEIVAFKSSIFINLMSTKGFASLANAL